MREQKIYHHLNVKDQVWRVSNDNNKMTRTVLDVEVEKSNKVLALSGALLGVYKKGNKMITNDELKKTLKNLKASKSAIIEVLAPSI